MGKKKFQIVTWGDDTPKKDFQVRRRTLPVLGTLKLFAQLLFALTPQDGSLQQLEGFEIYPFEVRRIQPLRATLADKSY